MDKNALRELLAQQVQQKVDSGYEVKTYAADLAGQDALKRSLSMPVAQRAPKKKDADAYDLYLESVKNGTYTPIKEDEDLQEGYRRRDYEREAKGAVTVQSRSTGNTSVLGSSPGKPDEQKRKPNIRLDDLAQFR